MRAAFSSTIALLRANAAVSALIARLLTTQITVRLPDENVAWLDAEVAAGRFPSRTAGLAKLLTKAQTPPGGRSGHVKDPGQPGAR